MLRAAVRKARRAPASGRCARTRRRRCRPRDGSTRSRSANSDQNCASMRRAAERVGQQAELRAQEPDERVPVAAHERRWPGRAARARRRARGAPGRARSRPGRPSSCRRGARGRSPARPSRRRPCAAKKRGVVGRQRRLARAAEAREVERVDAVAAAERRRGVEERGLRAAQAVQQQDVVGPSPIVSVETFRRPTGTSRMRSSGGRPSGSRNMPSKPSARSSSPRA